MNTIKAGHRVHHHGEAHFLQFSRRQNWRGPAFDVVGHGRRVDLGRDGAHLLNVGRGLDKHHVGTDFAKYLAALNRRFQAVHRVGVGAGHDDEIRVGARIQRRFQLGNHFGRFHHRLAGHVAAALGRHLILDEHAGQPGALIGAHGARHIDDIAKAGVAIAEQRQCRGIANAGVEIGHLGHGQLAGVGSAQQCCGGRIAAGGQRGEPGLFGNAGAQSIVHPGEIEDLGCFDKLPETRGFAHVCLLFAAMR